MICTFVDDMADDIRREVFKKLDETIASMENELR